MNRPICLCGMKMEYAKIPKSWGCDHGKHGFAGVLQGPGDDQYGVKVRAQIKAWTNAVKEVGGKQYGTYSNSDIVRGIQALGGRKV